MHTQVQNVPALLLVEKNDVIRESLRDWITMLFPDVRLIEAADHRAGISVSQADLPDIVLLDISGLGRGGIQTVRRTRAALPTAVILALVALEQESYRQAVLDAGAEACACIWRIRSELLPQLIENLEPEW